MKDAFLSWIPSACLQGFAFMLLLLLYVLVRGTQTLGHPYLREESVGVLTEVPGGTIHAKSQGGGWN